jgi:hypothetical protein
MTKHLIMLLLLFAGVTLGWCDSDSSETSKTAALRNQMTDIAELDDILGDIIDQLTAVQTKLLLQLDELAEEIGKYRNDFKLNSYQKALEHPRIVYNLQLIQQLVGYNERIEAKILYFRNGQETLTYYLSQAEDDLQMLNTLKDGDVDDLITKVNTALNELRPVARMPVLTLESVVSEPTEALWNDLLLNPHRNRMQRARLRN